MEPLIVLVGSYALLRLVAARMRPSGTHWWVGTTALGIMFLFTGVGHFLLTEPMVAMLPPFVPYRRGIVLLSGIAEILLGLALMLPGSRRRAAIVAVLLLVLLLPSNIYAALARVPAFNHGMGPVYLLFRIPLQALFIGWALFFYTRLADRRPVE